MAVEITLKAVNVRVENVLIISNLAEPSTSKKPLTRHVLHFKIVVGIYCDLLIAALKSRVLAARLISEDREGRDKILYIVVGINAGRPIGFRGAWVGPHLAVRSASCPCNTLVSIVLRTSDLPSYVFQFLERSL